MIAQELGEYKWRISYVWLEDSASVAGDLKEQEWSLFLGKVTLISFGQWTRAGI